MKKIVDYFLKNKSEIGDACISVIALTTTCIMIIDKYKNN